MDLRKPLERSLKDKRGMGIGDIYPAILMIGLVAILIGVILFVLDEFGEQFNNQVASVDNETLTSPWAAINQTVDEATECNFQEMALKSPHTVTNATTGVVLLAGNYTIYSDGKIINATPQTDNYSSGAWNISYEYVWGGASCEATEDIVDEIADFVPWMGIILLVIAAAIVLGLLVRNLAGGQRV